MVGVMAVPLNTLAYARRLREVGFTEQQAEGQADALADAMTDSLATKTDLRELEGRMLARFEAMDAKFDSLSTQMLELERRFELRLSEQIANLERRMTVRMLAGIGAVSALVRLL